MNNSQFPTARKSGLVIQEVPDEILVFDLDTNKAHCLNLTAATVWKSCDGKTSIQEIASILEKQSGKGVSDDVVWLAIDQLNENSLLEGELTSKFAGQTRREVIKKIGLASMVAIPVVASLVAPRNAMANVSCACGGIGGSALCQTAEFASCGSTCCNGVTGICQPEPGGCTG
jgi:Coenzyme PQQ synthesis protein D (PqqD)